MVTTMSDTLEELTICCNISESQSNRSLQWANYIAYYLKLENLSTSAGISSSGIRVMNSELIGNGSENSEINSEN